MSLAVAEAAYACRATAERPAAPTPRQKRLLRNKRQHSRELEQRRKEQRLPQKQEQQQEPPSPPPPAGYGGPELQCPHFASCSGCTVDTGLDAPPLLHEARAFFERDCGLPAFTLHVGNIHGWRQRARLAVRRGTEGQTVIGLFEERTHMATAIPSCVVHHPAINEAAALLQQAVEACGVEPYDEGQRTGQLRYVQLTAVQQRDSGGAALAPAVQLVLVWNSHRGTTQQQQQGNGSSSGSGSSSSSSRLASLADQLWRVGQRRPDGTPLLHSLWANFQPERSNKILGPEWRLLHGPDLAWARLGGADIAFGPGSFMQANREAMDCCLAVMQQYVAPGSTIADLHAGVGTIRLSLAATCRPRWVRFVEINGHGLPPFRQSGARLRLRLLERGEAPQLDYHVAAAGSDPGRWCHGAEVVVCDPPRKGLEAALLGWLCSPAAAAAGVRSLLYLSCGFPALQHDAAQLLGSGRWRLRHARGFAFFPGASHVETLAVFDVVQQG